MTGSLGLVERDDPPSGMEILVAGADMVRQGVLSRRVADKPAFRAQAEVYEAVIADNDGLKAKQLIEVNGVILLEGGIRAGAIPHGGGILGFRCVASKRVPNRHRPLS